jgi:cell division protein FtsQ
MTAPAPPRPAPDFSGTRLRHRRWPYVLAVSLVLMLLGGAGYVLYRTPVLGVERIEVLPQDGQVTGEVAAAVQSAVGVPNGTPLIKLDLAAIRNGAMTVPQVAAASVSRNWPNTLQIRVTERVPAAVTSANGALWLLDSSGFAYLKVPGGKVPSGLLTIELATPGPDDPATSAALAVVAGLNSASRSLVTSVSARSAYSVALNLRDGRSVLWGSPEDSAKKLQILPAVLAQPGRIYDISDPNYVTVSP